MKRDQLLLIVMGIVVSGFIVTHPSMNSAEQPIIVPTTPHIDDQLLTYQGTGMIMVDKKALRSLLDDAKRQGSDLNVAVYEYDKKMEVWNRAEKWCK